MKGIVLSVLQFIGRHWIVCLLAALLLYLIVGAMAPFWFYKPVSREFAESFDVDALAEPVDSGDRAMILETNISAWEERIRLMEQARERIILSTFDMRDGESTRDLCSVLLHKAQEGVRVQILVDGFSGFLRMEGKPLFYALSSHPNIEIRIYNPVRPWFPWTTQGRMHDKYVIVDELAYILGGRNTFDYFIGDYEKEDMSFDRELLIYNDPQKTGGVRSSLYEVRDYFESVWALKVCVPFHEDESLANREGVIEQRALLEQRYASLKADYPQLFDDGDYKARTKETQGVHLLSGPTGIYGKEPQIFYMLTQLMETAREKVTIHSPYAVCNAYMYEQLARVSASVPEAVLMINSVNNGDNLVASSDYLKNKKHLIDTGLQIYEYDGGYSYHGKSIVIDDQLAVVGSYNLDLRSTYMDTELMLVVNSKAIAQELSGYMQAMEADSRMVVDEHTYVTPEHVTVEPIPFGKRVVYFILGIVLAPFRCVI